MKFIVIIGDGMADFPIDELNGKTPLMVADKPFMDMMARQGQCGKVLTIPEGFPPGSDVACMSVFGYNPLKYYTGRAPIEAAGMGISMDETDVAYRCNLVYLKRTSDKTLMGDYSGGHITTEEAKILIEDLGSHLCLEGINFFPGVSYRHIMIWKDGIWEMETTPPHDITDMAIDSYLPKGKGAERIIEIMELSQRFLENHPVNRKREESGKMPANSIWLWGQGRKARFSPFREKYGLKGATVAAVDLIKGISRLIGFDAPYVKGATGYIDTDYSAKAKKALELLKEHDIVYIHIEAPDEASHNGSLKEKIKAIESIDNLIVRRVYEETEEKTRILITTDHATPLSMRTHFACPVPFVIYEKGKELKGNPSGYNETCEGKNFDGEGLITYFLEGAIDR
ncbi:MAG: cofactor-independent phosphoglycerate mutase [Syntrophorhabdaceae bacterium]|nr:cofactor-independent phosphoglycerate mutase [Syntrophorhabdaceae bacterium]